MRFFQYSATDASGRPATGTIRAASEESARDALTQAGYRVSQVVDPGPQSAAQMGRAAQSAKPRIAAVPRPAVNATAQPAPRPVEAPTPIAIQPPKLQPAVSGGVKTKFGRDKDLFFLFTQIGQYYRAGVTPQTALHDLANKAPSRYQESLLEAEKAVGEGKPLSSVLGRYPYLYSPDIIGTLKAGEISGYVAEACEKIGDQKMTSHRLNRKLAILWVLTATLIILFPISLSVVHGALRSIAEQDKANGALPITGTLTHSIGIELLHSAPWTLPLFAGIVGLTMWWLSMPMREVRHRLILGVPFLGPRVRAEAMARFTWALGMVSRGGTSPHETFNLAAEGVPNLVIRRHLMEAASTMTESERLSIALRRSGTLPTEYAHIVETGETTGDVPRALADISRATDADFRGRDSSAATLTSMVVKIALFVVAAIAAGVLYRVLEGGIITTLTNSD